MAKKEYKDLTPEQQHMIDTKAKTQGKVQYFDDIKQLYFQAIQKHKPNVLTGKEQQKDLL